MDETEAMIVLTLFLTENIKGKIYDYSLNYIKFLLSLNYKIFCFDY